MFVNRKRELEALESSYTSNRAELFVLYGRRRVGKTELLRAFCEGKRCIFFVAGQQERQRCDRRDDRGLPDRLYSCLYPADPQAED